MQLRSEVMRHETGNANTLSQSKQRQSLISPPGWEHDMASEWSLVHWPLASLSAKEEPL